MEITENKINPQKEVQVQPEQPAAKFDPNKRYNWTPETEFVIKGGEFGVLVAALRTILSTEEASRILLAERANQILDRTLALEVQKGTVVEDTKQVPNMPR